MRLTDGAARYARIEGTFGVEFQSSDVLTVQLLDTAEQLTEPYSVFGDIEIPAGTIRFPESAARSTSSARSARFRAK